MIAQILNNMPFNTLLFSQINSFTLNYFWFDVLVIFLAHYLPFILLGILFLLLLKDHNKYLEMIAKALTAALVAGAITTIIRLFYIHPRPFIIQDIIPLVSHTAGNSFPSLHTSFFFALSIVFLLFNKKIGILFLVASFLIVTSRVIAGLHWPSDILAGIALGIASALLTVKLLKNHLN